MTCPVHTIGIPTGMKHTIVKYSYQHGMLYTISSSFTIYFEFSLDEVFIQFLEVFTPVKVCVFSHVMFSHHLIAISHPGAEVFIQLVHLLHTIDWSDSQQKLIYSQKSKNSYWMGKTERARARERERKRKRER